VCVFIFVLFLQKGFLFYFVLLLFRFVLGVAISCFLGFFSFCTCLVIFDRFALLLLFVVVVVFFCVSSFFVVIYESVVCGVVCITSCCFFFSMSRPPLCIMLVMNFLFFLLSGFFWVRFFSRSTPIPVMLFAPI